MSQRGEDQKTLGASGGGGLPTYHLPLPSGALGCVSFLWPSVTPLETHGDGQDRPRCCP